MKQLLLASGALAVLSFAFVGCSSATTDPGVQPPPGAQGGGTCSETDKNPKGDCYPTTDIGTKARTGTSGLPGQRISNFAFTGYPWADVTQQVTTGTPKTIRLSDYFDPNQVLGAAGTGIKIIHITVAAVWCGPCNEETDFISGGNFTGANPGATSFAKELAPLGVVFVQAISDGPVVGHGATLSDLNSWISNHTSDITTMLDPGVANLGVFFDAAAVPFNANIDARSMEILNTDLGFDTQMDVTIKSWINWVGANPAKQ